MTADRHDKAIEIARQAGGLALEYFQKVAELTVVNKGAQDFVTEADQMVETRVRELIAKAFPDDGIVGEEHAPKQGTTGYTWVIDPIDGTTNFINSIPAWTVVLAVVHEDQTVVGVIHDANHSETFSAQKGRGAAMNGAPMVCPPDARIDSGTVSVGYGSHANADVTSGFLRAIMARGGVFSRLASGALSLAYVASGRFVGYLEQHMNAWDCLAGQLIIAEAGGRVEQQSANQMIASGGRVIAGSAGLFDELVEIADSVMQGKH